MRPDSFCANGAPLAFNDARYSGLSAGIPGTRRRWELRPEALRHLVARPSAAARHRVARDGFAVDQTFVRPDRRRTSTGSTTSRRRRRSTSTPTARRATSARRCATPTSRAPTELIGRDGARGFYRGELAERDGRRRAAPAGGRRRQPRLAPRPDDRATTSRRYRAIERDPTRIGYRGLDVWGMGPPSSGGSTVGEALNILEGYQTSARRPRAGAAPLPRGVALHVRRPQRLPRRPRLLRRAARRPALGRLRRRAARADRPEHAATSPVAPGDPYDNQRQRPAPARQRDDQPPAPVDHAPHGRPTARATSSPTRSRSSRPAATASSCPATGFLLNNELTDFNFDSLTHPNRADGGKRPRSSMSPTIVTRDGAAVPGGRLAGRLDDHHAPCCRSCSSGSTSARRCPRRSRAARGPAQHGDDARRSRRSSTRPRARRCSARTATRSPPDAAEIGAVDGHRVPARRPDSRRGRAGAPRRRQRRVVGSTPEAPSERQSAANVVDGL